MRFQGTWYVVVKVFLLLLGISSFKSTYAQKEIPVSINGYYGKKKWLSNVFVAKEYYDNGNVRFKGQYLKCTVRDVKLNSDRYEVRKVGRWTYYHNNGHPEREENYAHGKNCSSIHSKSGKWKYWNEKGELYFEEEYLNDTLISSAIEIYNRNDLQKKIITRGKQIDTIQVAEELVSENLVRNSDFESYKHKPVTVTNSGQNSIEDLIPDWISPDHKTPDYYNFNRKVKGVFNIANSKLSDHNGYVGLVLYHEQSNNYLEYLQTKLIQNLKAKKMYCFKLDIQLSQNSGYKIDGFGVRLFNNSISFSNLMRESNDTLSSVTKIDFRKPMHDTQQWVSFCQSFIAKGDEELLAIGRFRELSDVLVEKNVPQYINALDINRSAYYLIDNVKVFPVSSSVQCSCEEHNFPPLRATESAFTPSIFLNLRKEDKVILKNVQFEMNSAKILNSSLPELEKLRDVLLSSPMTKIKINGHTDNTGTVEYNLNLSKLRAKAVRDWLVEKGIDVSRLEFDGYGSDDPIANNLTEESRQLNRRVEIIILEK